MKESILSRTLRYSVYVYIALAVSLVVLGLGFTTNFYPLFYNGTPDMYQFYKDVQVLNKAMFNGALVFVILGVLMMGFDLNKHKHGLIGMIYTLLAAAYTVNTGLVILRNVPYYSSLYHSFDFSAVENYVPSYWIFTLTQVAFAVTMAISAIIAVLAVIRYFTTLKDKEASINE